MTPEEADTLRNARRTLLSAREQYAAALVDAHARGHSIRTIADALGVTHGAVHRIIKAARS